MQLQLLLIFAFPVVFLAVPYGFLLAPPSLFTATFLAEALPLKDLAAGAEVEDGEAPVKGDDTRDDELAMESLRKVANIPAKSLFSPPRASLNLISFS